MTYILPNEHRARLDTIALANGNKTVDQFRLEAEHEKKVELDALPNWLTDKEKRRHLKLIRKLDRNATEETE